jgi:hypothetical protein
MNKLRSDDTSPVLKYFKITPYWLLGFVEGDGFAVNLNVARL